MSPSTTKEYRRQYDRRYKEVGFRYRYTTSGCVDAFARGLRLAGTIGEKHPTYRYEREVEDFFRHSPAVVRATD